MTEKEIKTKLSRVRVLIREQNRIILQAQKLEDRITTITQQLSDMPRGSTPFTTLDYVVAVDDLRSRFQALVKEEAEEYKEALLLIDQLDGLEKDILVKYYLMMMKWDEVADSIGKGLRWTQTLHGRAIKKLAEISQKAC